jgi:hypothetical protein
LFHPHHHLDVLVGVSLSCFVVIELHSSSAAVWIVAWDSLLLWATVFSQAVVEATSCEVVL